MMDVDFLPEHLIIIGGSYIGLEFAQMYRRFGSRSRCRDGPKLIGREDDEVSEAVKEILESEGIDIGSTPTASGWQRARRRCGHRKLRAGTEEIVGSHVLLAVGRKPNTDDLGWKQPV